jgi:hypothetical protein
VLIRFFLMLRAAGVPVSLTEFLALLDALEARLVGTSAEDFYWVARAVLVKDERHYDRFDRVFAAHFKGAELALEALLATEIPADWLKPEFLLRLSEEEKARIQSLGGWDALMKTLRERLAEQKARHQGGNKWIGTGGTSPFGHGGYNPEGIRIGGAGGNRSAVKVWDRREYANLDDSVELGTRNVKLALRRLRRFARQGAAETLDLDGTIDSTARRAGLLDIRMVPERRNAVKVLLFLDIGGSMDEHVRICEELFSARARRVQAPRALLLPQFRLRVGVEGQPPPPRRAHAASAAHANLWPRLPARDSRRRDDEPLRDTPAGRQHRALERRTGRRLDEAPARELPATRVAEPGAAGSLGLHALGAHHARAARGPDVPATLAGLDRAMRSLQ